MERRGKGGEREGEKKREEGRRKDIVLNRERHGDIVREGEIDRKAESTAEAVRKQEITNARNKEGEKQHRETKKREKKQRSEEGARERAERQTEAAIASPGERWFLRPADPRMSQARVMRPQYSSLSGHKRSFLDMSVFLLPFQLFHLYPFCSVVLRIL